MYALQAVRRNLRAENRFHDSSALAERLFAAEHQCDLLKDGRVIGIGHAVTHIDGSQVDALMKVVTVNEGFVKCFIRSGTK
jgi:hypothetical protein